MGNRDLKPLRFGSLR